MNSKCLTIRILLFVLLLIFPLIAGCSPKPPVEYQQLQIQDSEEANGFDVYLYVAVKPDTPQDKVESLLKWFNEVKFAKAKKMRIYVWNNPAAALMNSSGNLVGSLNVDRGANVIEITSGDKVK
jgi:hypothetical protein